jgi:hypothetical protein
MRRVVGCVFAAAACLVLLAACSKPAPQVSVQSGTFFTTIAPSTYCFDPAHCRTQRLELPPVSAKLNGSVLIDVPRAVVHNGWRVSALATPTLASLGSPATPKDSHTFRVQANINNGNPFIVRIQQLHHGKPDGSIWSFIVTISDST